MQRRLYRSRTDRILGGVAGGLADYFSVDVTLVRLAWVVLALAGGGGVLVYIIAWIVIPEAPALGRWVPAPRPAATPEAAGTDQPPAEDQPGATETPPAGNGPPDQANPRTPGGTAEQAERMRQLFGIILVGLGAWLLAANLVPWLRLGKLWPLVLVALGLALLARGLGRRGG